MDARYIAMAIPFFFLLIGVEILVNRRIRRGDSQYRFPDSISNLGCGMGQQVMEVLLHAVVILPYLYVYEHHRLMTLSMRSAGAWIAILFGVDLCYYLFHRASHRVNFLWACHIVHHQSEEYNLSVALRQAWFDGLFTWAFYLPLALLGFPPLMYLTMHTLNTLYQFWIHTRAVGRLGPLEWVLNTPSHHRVHHGIDPRYIDKNYGGIFIIWDRLLGTYTREDGEPVYGTVKPLASWNPLWANIEHWVYLVRSAWRARRPIDRLGIFFMPPEWRPEDLGGRVTIPEVSRGSRAVYDKRAPRAVNAYVGFHFVGAAIALTGLLYFQAALTPAQRAALVACILLSLPAWGGLLELRPWGLRLELLRLCLITLSAAWVVRSAPLCLITLGLSALSAAWIWRAAPPGSLPEGILQAVEQVTRSARPAPRADPRGPGGRPPR